MEIKQWYKIEKRKFKWIWISAFVFIIFLALMDIWGMPFWNKDITSLYAKQFWTFVFVAVLLAGIMYYIFKRDKSESVAVVVAFYSLILTGWEDIFFYLIKDHSLPASMPHLMNHFVIGWIPRTFGMETVTPFTLILIAGVGLLVGIPLTNYLIKKL